MPPTCAISSYGSRGFPNRNERMRIEPYAGLRLTGAAPVLQGSTRVIGYTINGGRVQMEAKAYVRHKRHARRGIV
jgi:hypothetical protein